MFIQTEATPNPATVKFLPGQAMLSGGPVDCPDFDTAAAKSPLAERLFQIEGVSGVMIATDSVAVTKTETADWDILKLQIMGMLVEHLSAGQAVVYETASAPVLEDEHRGDDSVEAQIKTLIETRVRPIVSQDGGDIVFESYVDGIVYLRMKGACAGCPSATLTLKNGVEKMLQAYVPEVIAVQQV